VCERWKLPRGEGFRNFLADMDPRPAGKTLDRINPQGRYEPTNGRWADAKVQANNQGRIIWKHCTPPPVERIREGRLSTVTERFVVAGGESDNFFGETVGGEDDRCPSRVLWENLGSLQRGNVNLMRLKAAKAERRAGGLAFGAGTAPSEAQGHVNRLGCGVMDEKLRVQDRSFGKGQTVLMC